LLTRLRDRYGPFDFVYKEYNNIGHGYPREGLGPMYSWLQSKVRNPYPRMVIHTPARVYKPLLWWLKVRVSREWGGGLNVAKVERNNRIGIEAGCNGAEIFLHEKMGISLSREIVVEKEGSEIFRGSARYSAAALLESFGQNRDPEHYYYAKIKLP
jgi:hypothetical protein